MVISSREPNTLLPSFIEVCFNDVVQWRVRFDNVDDDDDFSLMTLIISSENLTTPKYEILTKFQSIQVCSLNGWKEIKMQA